MTVHFSLTFIVCCCDTNSGATILFSMKIYDAVYLLILLLHFLVLNCYFALVFVRRQTLTHKSGSSNIALDIFPPKIKHHTCKLCINGYTNRNFFQFYAEKNVMDKGDGSMCVYSKVMNFQNLRSGKNVQFSCLNEIFMNRIGVPTTKNQKKECLS